MKLNYKNINEFLKENHCSNPLGYTTSNIDRNDFEEIGSL